MEKKRKCYLLGRNKCEFRFPRYVQIFILICGMLNFVSCNDDENKNGGTYDPGQGVTVSNILPETGGILTPVVIEGKNFGTDKTKVQVLFNEREALIINVVNEYIYALVPKCSGGDNIIKVIVDGKNEGTLQNSAFNYIVSSKVTSVAPELTTKLSNLKSISVDDEENLLITQYIGTYPSRDVVLLYSAKDNVMSQILDLGAMGTTFQGGCFSRDYKKYYILPGKISTALVIVLNKSKNWEREMIYDSDGLTEKVVRQVAITVDDDGYIYTYSLTADGGIIVKIDPVTQKAKKIATFAVEDEDVSITFNPKDKYIYMCITRNSKIMRFDSRKEDLTDTDLEWVTGAYAGTYQDGTFDKATFSEPYGIECDDDHNLYLAEYRGRTIRKIDLTKGLVSTFAGQQGPGGYRDGSAEEALFQYPLDVAVTRNGIVYVLEETDNRLRCVAVQ